MIKNEEALLAKRTQSWSRLDQLCGKAESSFRSLSGDEVVEYVRLYRQASADLAFLMTHSSNADVVHYLNAIVGRAYAQLYRTPKRPFWANLWHSVGTAAQTVRRRKRPVWLAIAIFFAAAFIVAGILNMDPASRQYFIPPEFESTFDHWKSGEHPPRTGDENMAAFGMYASHNPMVAIMTNALSSATFGIFTVYAMWSNGALIGALAAETATVGHLDFLLISIFPHGISEIGGFFIAAGAGFVMGGALIKPGRRTRGEALRIASKDALVMLLLSLFMIFLAAPIEGYFSFNPAVPDWAKIAFSVVALTAWISFFVGFSKTEEESIESAEETRWAPSGEPA